MNNIEIIWWAIMFIIPGIALYWRVRKVNRLVNGVSKRMDEFELRGAKNYDGNTNRD